MWPLATLALVGLLFVAYLLLEGSGTGKRTSGSEGGNAAGAGSPQFDDQVVASGLNRPWDLKFLPGGELLFTQRDGYLHVWRDGSASRVARISEARFISERSEGGLTGMAVDPQFGQNRRIYLCYNSTSDDVRISSYRLAESLDGVSERRDLVTGITANPSGRHSGCRMDFGPDGYLWIGTGDAAIGGLPQQPDSLNGKILRISTDGQAAPDNPGGGLDSRVYSYGHRNTQGLAFFRAPLDGVAGVSSEHGPSVDDEVNPLRPGNFGWAPAAGGYDESVPMTDRRRYPDAVRPLWESGSPTQAPSGLAIVYGQKWREWQGAVAMAMQKAEHLKILRLGSQANVIGEERVLEGTYGRLRAVQLGPDGSLYISTDNGDDDRIIRLTPR